MRQGGSFRQVFHWTALDVNLVNGNLTCQMVRYTEPSGRVWKRAGPVKKNITLRRWLDETICLSLSINQSDTRRVLSPAEPVEKSNLKRVEQIFQRESLRCSSLLFFQLIAPWYIYYTPDITDVTTASYTLREPRLDGFARSRDGTILFIQLPPRHKEPSNMDAIPRMLGWVRQLWICTWNISNKTVPAGECWEYASCFKDPCFHYRAAPLSVEHWAFGNHSTLLLAGLIVSGFLPHRHHTFSLSRMAVPSLAQRTAFQICGDSLMLEVGFGRLQGCLHSVA